jgi:hypothetical protein
MLSHDPGLACSPAEALLNPFPYVWSWIASFWMRDGDESVMQCEKNTAVSDSLSGEK